MHPPKPRTQTSIPPLLRLPLELRRQIYATLLPHTTSLAIHTAPPTPPRTAFNLTFVRHANSTTGSWQMQRTGSPQCERSTGHDIVWRRGSTALLGVCRQVHDETATMVYGENTFVLDVTYERIVFWYRWRTEKGLVPSTTLDWVGHFSQRNLLRVRRYVVNVESVDEYTGMIKYNVGGRGLPAGIRARVGELVGLMVLVREGLGRVHVHLIDGDISRHRFPSGRVHRVQDERHYAQTQTVLDPFRALCGVGQVQVTGVSEGYANVLEASMAAQRGTAHA